MDLLKRVDENAKAIRNVGKQAAARAKAGGRPVYFIDETVGPGIIEQLPDGARRHIVVSRSKAAFQQRS